MSSIDDLEAMCSWCSVRVSVWGVWGVVEGIVYTDRVRVLSNAIVGERARDFGQRVDRGRQCDVTAAYGTACLITRVSSFCSFVTTVTQQQQRSISRARGAPARNPQTTR